MLLIAATAFPSGAFAASVAATQASRRIQTYFEQLADSDPAVREEAKVALMGLRRSDLGGLRQIVVAAHPIAPAQAAVLRDIVIHVYLAGEPYTENVRAGFLGAMLGEVPVTTAIPNAPPGGTPTTGVLINDTIEGFCSHRFLRRGDVVLAVIGTDVYPTPDRPDLQLRVKVTPPGEPITLQLLRQGKIMRVTFRVDPFPWAAENFVMDELRNKRMEKAAEYWQRVFEPAVDPVTVPVKGDAPSNHPANT